MASGGVRKAVIESASTAVIEVNSKTGLVFRVPRLGRVLVCSFFAVSSNEVVIGLVLGGIAAIPLGFRSNHRI